MDATGNRRFLPVRCGSQEPLLDLFDSGAAGHFEQAWAEAMARFAPSAGTAFPGLVLPRGVVGTANQLAVARQDNGCGNPGHGRNGGGISGGKDEIAHRTGNIGL